MREKVKGKKSARELLVDDSISIQGSPILGGKNEKEKS
jgi:hypothetical protein